ncbi:MAG TPA: hypothetical protein DEP69_04155 [Acidimicrobiaceae bacterium]|nr:hypothetical protein [Acidimicrobiaceae bacterium]
MGLIARALEASGLPTLSLSSARDITRAVRPPRAAYLDYPLGHTAGRPHEPALNKSILADTLRAFETLAEPGAMAHLDYRWADTDDWKEKAFAPSDSSSGPSSGAYEDDRTERHETPQYQSDADAAAAAASHDGEDCLVCAGVDY